MSDKKVSKFVPRPDQVDYSTARWAPVINCVVHHEDKILIVQRNPDMHFYPEYWNGISGFLDDHLSLEEKVKGELKEELGIDAKDILEIKLGEIFHQEEPKYKKTWIVHPIKVTVATNVIKLDWEATTYRWVRVEDALKLDLLPGFDAVLKKVSVI